MNALANPQVGRCLNQHFVASFQKVGTFRIVNGQKQGGNVAAYFCLPDSQVLHAVAGPVDAATLLREARWVVETWKMALVEAAHDPGQERAFFRQAHADRLRQDHGLNLNIHGRGRGNPVADFAAAAFAQANRRNLSPQGRVHLLLAAFPLPKIEEVYAVVFENILGEKVSTLPVDERS